MICAVYTLHCDVCKAKLESPSHPYTSAAWRKHRAEAKRAGWWNIGGRDFCPDCAKKMDEATERFK